MSAYISAKYVLLTVVSLVCIHFQPVAVHAQSGVKQSILSVCLSVCLSHMCQLMVNETRDNIMPNLRDYELKRRTLTIVHRAAEVA